LSPNRFIPPPSSRSCRPPRCPDRPSAWRRPPRGRTPPPQGTQPKAPNAAHDRPAWRAMVVSPAMGGSRRCGIALAALVWGAASLTAPTPAVAGVKPPPGCRGSSGLSSVLEERAPAQLPGSVEPAIASGFGVLRRASNAGDQPPPLNPLAEEVGYRLAGYYPGQVRQLFSLPDGRRFFLVVGLPRVFAIPPARCLPRQLRSQRNQLVEEELKRAREPIYCIAAVAVVPAAG